MLILAINSSALYKGARSTTAPNCSMSNKLHTKNPTRELKFEYALLKYRIVVQNRQRRVYRWPHSAIRTEYYWSITLLPIRKRKEILSKTPEHWNHVPYRISFWDTIYVTENWLPIYSRWLPFVLLEQGFHFTNRLFDKPMNTDE